MKLEFDVTEVVITSLGGHDEIRLKYGDQAWIHITTQRGNGEACLHKLGWRGVYIYTNVPYITRSGAETRHMLGSVLEEDAQKHKLQREIAIDTGEPIVTVKDSKSAPWTPTQKQTAWMLAEILRLRAKVRELTWPASMTQADMQELKEGVEARKRLIKDLSPEERAKLARELREWREVID